jgi:branched-chain amino acid transport system ATP-binding protein
MSSTAMHQIDEWAVTDIEPDRRDANETPRPDDVVVIEGVDIFYGAVQALFAVDLRVGAGETVAVLGGNASGKSTMIKTALGMVQPRTGAVRVLGRPIAGLEPFRVIGLGVGSIPEGRRVFAEMSVRENLLMGAFVRRQEAKATLARDIDEATGLFPVLQGRMSQLAGTLSGGEQQMLAMARAWMRKPRLLCIDEPSMGLSPLYVDRVYEAIAALKARGATILMVEQSANRALEIADRAYVLRSGHVVVRGRAAALAGDPAIRRAYLGERAIA